MIIKFETSGAAFCDPFTGEEDALYKSAECIVILKKITVDIACGQTSGSIMDINGNKIGEWKL